jgi:septum formation protein
LASSSPRRRELLRGIIPRFEVAAPEGAEETSKKYPARAVMDLARKKAAEVGKRVGAYDLIIACDTAVYSGGTILGKPKDAADALNTLRLLNAATHKVYSGVCLLTNDACKGFYDKTYVTFFEHSDAELERYIAEYKPFDKAGAYGVQDGFLRIKTVGSLDNVIGLPTEKLKRYLIYAD